MLVMTSQTVQCVDTPHTKKPKCLVSETLGFLQIKKIFHFKLVFIIWQIIIF